MCSQRNNTQYWAARLASQCIQMTHACDNEALCLIYERLMDVSCIELLLSEDIDSYWLRDPLYAVILSVSLFGNLGIQAHTL